ncbi:dynamin family protein [Paenibacillus segetis]|uniref:GTPase n=1 Tax=Paenibacillus segetis TaxID=1325360 RepID=A0ABQ1YGB6_9BACL|nr:dynamin family protein [Paenibacillus segetis]GGH23970.1 GTPase [Paenibacillus segetis]
MATITTSQDYPLQLLLDQLRAQYKMYGDMTTYREIDDLQEKLNANELTLSFCGHFSAGKSSLINSLCGKAVLPSSPLPTTANVSVLRHGLPKALLTPVNVNGDVISEEVHVPIEELEKYCRDGNSYSMVSVWDEIPLLGEHGVLLDTPGVDSGDAAHALVTNSALHLGDVVFYVMDYNHVLSESNLSFAKVLADWGKPLYLVINQMDKHREDEVSYEAYQKSVQNVFELWGIVPSGVFYISLKELTHPLNMLSQLRECITELLTKRTELLNYSIACSAHHGALSFLKRYEVSEEDERFTLIQEIGGENAVLELPVILTALEEKIHSNQGLIESRRMEFTKELDRLLGSVHIMTPSLREAGELYLASRESSFKTGLLFKGGKTQREKERRRDDFLSKLKEGTAAQVDWHVRDLLRRYGRSEELWSAEWETEMDRTLPQAEESWITEPAQEGALLSGDYTLRYAAAVAAGIAGRYRRVATLLFERLLAEVLAPRVAVAAQELAAQREALLVRSKAAARLKALDAAAKERAERLQALLGAAPSLPPGILPEVRDLQPLPDTVAAAVASAPAAPATPAVAAAEAPHAPAVPAAAAGNGQRRLTAAAEVLEAAAEVLGPYPAFGTGVRELRARASHLRGGKFTVALFGAFSAGKSSFANALLGSEILPVSPHPTTAAINVIMAPQQGMEHGQAKIIFKSLEAMKSDLTYSFESLQLGPWKEQNWLSQVSKIKISDVPPSGRAHYSFLRAAASGWSEYANHLGGQIVANLEDFSSYVSDENKACFVAEIQLYYACPLTEQGLVIVDTPGADSIHARHTNVTFQYMKNSDALVYVTYYNHAFSRADRQFLAHLGRAKGSFALDKMFFIVNAADLAATSGELEEVIEYVQDGLRGAGIDSPQIYAVSSQMALDARKRNEEVSEASGFAKFERAFFEFISQDSAGLLIDAAQRELNVIMDRVDQWTTTIMQSKEERLAHIEKLQEDRKIFVEELDRLKLRNRDMEIRQEIEELLYHVRQRLRFLAGDLFLEYFHPSLLQDDGGDLKRKFNSTFHGWLAGLSLELEREIQVTSLRVEQKCTVLLDMEYNIWMEELKGRLMNIPAFVAHPAMKWASVLAKEGWLEQALQPGDYWMYFKNPKTFFEGGGKQKLREAVESPLEDKVKEVMDEAIGDMFVLFSEEMARGLSIRVHSLNEQWDEWETGISDITITSDGEESWKNVSQKLHSMNQILHATI